MSERDEETVGRSRMQLMGTWNCIQQKIVIHFGRSPLVKLYKIHDS